MEKVVVVGYRAAGAPALERADIVALNHRLLAELDVDRYPGIALQVEDHETSRRWQGERFTASRRVAALLGVWAESADDPSDVTRLVGEVWPDHAASVVTETVIRWRTGRATNPTEPQPGWTVTSPLYRAPSMTRDEFVRHWIDVHQPMSLRIHPQDTYVRNIVTRVLSPAAPQFDAIAEEGFVAAEDILEPARFFGADLRGTTWRDNAAVIGDDVRLFLDAQHTAATAMREYRLREIRRPRAGDVAAPEQLSARTRT
ncbi:MULTISPECIES: EthD domain-containing protein [unclassified Frankia]|uniref:EthD domain-containing protein n=1 Tax=unclassified Frankia TaxID=2632575 RepID=UPI00200FE3C6|nr:MULTISPECIES: EthD domain-containing protein [unclassified Frankia]MCK9896340.1 EthD domain-containing protein [Frankia sp. AgB32]MCL9793243.1 EthD domain-containing protein [Frankia sp. AgKG'84/4]